MSEKRISHLLERSHAVKVELAYATLDEMNYIGASENAGVVNARSIQLRRRVEALEELQLDIETLIQEVTNKEIVS